MPPDYNLVVGDRVRFGKGIYYFQPNGSSCYLYLAKEHVGTLQLAVYSPPRAKVVPLSAQEADRLDGKIPPPRRPNTYQPFTMKKSETQLTREFVAELDAQRTIQRPQTAAQDGHADG